MDTAYKAGADVWVLPTHLSVPAVGVIPINAFLILASEPVLVNTGIKVDSEEFLTALRSLIDPEELRWVWLPCALVGIGLRIIFKWLIK